MHSTVKLIASSISEDTGVRIDTLQLHYPRIIHAEFMTHRVFSRNASSSRAIPSATILARQETFVPRFKKNQSGMQPAEYLSADEQEKAERIWNELARITREFVAELSDKNGLNIHKQWASRPTEWFSFIDVLVTSTEWSNFDALRVHEAAQDEIQELATEMKRLRELAQPRTLRPGQWHLPYIREEDEEDARQINTLKTLPDEIGAVIKPIIECAGVSVRDALLIVQSAARSCRLSYGKLDGEPTSLVDDMRRYNLLAGSHPKHASPLEHQARPWMIGVDAPRLQGNFVGWAQYRKFVPYESL